MKPAGYANQTYAVEFTVEGNLDGVTLQPEISEAKSDDPQGLFRETVLGDLGLLDPDYPTDEAQSRGTRGNRYVSFLWIEGASAGSSQASVDVVDVVNGTVSVQKNIGTFVGASRFFQDTGIFVPQGSMIRVRGLSGSTAAPIKVRFHFTFLDSALDIATAQNAVASANAAAQVETVHIAAWAFDNILTGTVPDYFAGFYFFGVTDDDFTTPAVLGTANVAYGAHALIVTGAVPGTDVRIRVSGNSINEEGVRVVGDTEDLVVPAGSPVNSYFETPKKWIGPMTFTHVSGPATTCNYGMTKYWDNNDADFIVRGLDTSWTAFANDPSIDIKLLHHKASGWTFNAAATPTPPTPIASLVEDYGTDDATAAGQNGAWDRTNLATLVRGGDDEGIIFQLDSTVVSSIVTGTMQVRITPTIPT